LRRTQLKADPDGRTFRYSNAGYALAGACIEAVSDKPWSSHLASEVLAPLGLESMVVGIGSPERGRLAPAMMWGPGGDHAAPLFNIGCAPAGSLLATIGELARYGQQLLTEPVVISRDALSEMWKVPDGQSAGYGLGFMVGDLDGRRTIGHGGVIYGYASELLLLPEAGLGIAMISTLDATNELVMRLCRYALRLALADRGNGEAPPLPRRLPTPSSSHANALAGEFENEAGATLEVRAIGTELMLVDRLVPMRIRALDDWRFALDGRLRGEGTAHPGPFLKWDGGDGVEWCGETWQRVRIARPEPAVETFGPPFMPTHLVTSAGGLCCVLETFFPHDCVPLGENRYRLGAGMYQDEILELDIETPDGGRAIRVGDMALERLN
jgi:D-alanyl-D-alanine dipeptidase